MKTRSVARGGSCRGISGSLVDQSRHEFRAQFALARAIQTFLQGPSEDHLAPFEWARVRRDAGRLREKYEHVKSPT